MNTINMPGFSAERSLTARSNRHPTRSRLTDTWRIVTVLVDVTEKFL